jgi:hypothetical protein
MMKEFDDTDRVVFVEEERDRVLESRFLASNQTPAMVRWMMKRGIAKTEQRAIYILLGVVIIAVAVSVFLFFSSIKSPSSPPPADPLKEIQK